MILPGAEHDLSHLPPELSRRVDAKISGLAVEPRPHGSQKLSAMDVHRLRVGDHRIVYEIDAVGHAIFVHRIAHRREVYRRLR